jgi:hypothetical protein
MAPALARPDLTLSCQQGVHRVCTRPDTSTCHCHTTGDAQ